MDFRAGKMSPTTARVVRSLLSVSHPLNLHQYSPITSSMTVSRLLVSHNLERSVTRRQLLYVRSGLPSQTHLSAPCCVPANLLRDFFFYLKRACTSHTMRGDLLGGVVKRTRFCCCFQGHPWTVIPNTAASGSISDRFLNTRGWKQLGEFQFILI